MSSETAQRLSDARRKLAQARQYLAHSRAGVIASELVLQGISRAHSGDDNALSAAVIEHQNKRDILQAALTREQQVRAAVNRELTEFLDTDETTTEVGSLSAAFPIV